MKKIACVLLALNTFQIKAQTSDPSSFSLFTNKDITVDLKAIDPDKGFFGIDYKLNLQRKLLTLSKDTFQSKNLNLNLISNGFLTVAGDKNQNNSIISELKLEGFPLLYARPGKITEPEPDWTKALYDPDLEEKASRFAKQVSSPFWLYLNLHAKHETSQDFKNYDFAFGGTVSFSSSFLNSLLDFPFGLLRVSKNNNPRQLDLSLGYDYVTGLRKTAYAKLNDSINYTNRLNLKAEWETGIFTQRDRLGFLVDTYHDLNAKPAMKGLNKDWQYFYMIRIDHLLNYNGNTKTLTKLSIKYTEGSLPPNFNKGYVIGAGFSIEF